MKYHSFRYRDDVIQAGQVGGNCDNFNKKLLDSHTDRQSYLQSWSVIDRFPTVIFIFVIRGAELKHFEASSEFVVDDDHCDVIFEKLTIVIKLDASINM